MNNLHAWSILKAHLVISTLASRLDTHTNINYLEALIELMRDLNGLFKQSLGHVILMQKKGAYLTTELTVEMGFLTENLISG